MCAVLETADKQTTDRRQTDDRQTTDRQTFAYLGPAGPSNYGASDPPRSRAKFIFS